MMTGIQSIIVWHSPKRTLPKVPEKFKYSGGMQVLLVVKDTQMVEFGWFDMYHRRFTLRRNTYDLSTIDWWAYLPEVPRVRKSA
jgi:hypothetical protein